MMINSIGLSNSKQRSTFILQMTIIAASAALLVGAAVLSAQTAPPAKLANARAEEFTVGKIAVLDTAAFVARPAFSRDGAWLAYLHNTGVPSKPRGIVIVSLPGGDQRRTIDFVQTIKGIAWSPDATRIFAVDDNNGGYIIDIGTANIISLGKVDSYGEMIWADAQSVYSLGDQAISRLDLETLSSSSFGNPMYVGNRESVRAKAAQLRKTPVDHPAVTLGTTLGGGGAFDINRSTVIAASNRDGSFTRVLSSEGFQTATFSPNAAHAVIEYFGGQLQLLTMGTRPRPRLALEATMVPLPNPIQASDLVGIRANLAQGKIVYADVFRPRINPLNQRTVGAEGRSKGLVRITSLGDDGNLEARFVREVDGYPATGDVLKTFWTPSPNQTEFKSASAVVGPLRDLPASPIETAVPKEPAAAVAIGSSGAAGAASVEQRVPQTSIPKVFTDFTIQNENEMFPARIYLDDEKTPIVIKVKSSYTVQLEVGSTHVVRVVQGFPLGSTRRINFTVARGMRALRVTPQALTFY